VKYQAYADENEELKLLFEGEKAELVKQVAEEKAALTKQVMELTEKDRVASEELRNARQELEQAKVNYEREVSLLAERKELEKEKAVVEAQALHNEEVRKLYDEMANLRKINEEMRERMQAEIEQLKQGNQDNQKK
jgi:hypothetical protein